MRQIDLRAESVSSGDSDVLRAHQFRCKERGEAPVPEGQSKGRKRSSCLSCVKLRTKCDQETPCNRCQELGKECVRGRSCRGGCWKSLTHSSPASSPQKQQEPNNRPKSRDAIPIHHLLNNPDGDDFVGRFPIRDTTGRLGTDEDDVTIGEPEDSSEASHWSEDFETNDVFIGAELPDLEINFDSFFGGFETMTFGAYPLVPDISQIFSGAALASPSAMALEPRAYEIRQVMMETASKLAHDFPENSHMLHLAPAIELLTPTEIDHCIGLFFGNYHRHCPILHRPSFHPTTVPTALLLAIVALGAMYSPEPAKVTWMKSLLDVMEPYIFSLPGLRDEFGGGLLLADATDEETLHYQFQSFQGAYLMVVVQYFSGNLAGRRRARRQRFTTVMSVSGILLHSAPSDFVQIARSFGLPTSQHGSIVAIHDEASFQRWVRKEVHIRYLRYEPVNTAHVLTQIQDDEHHPRP